MKLGRVGRIARVGVKRGLRRAKGAFGRLRDRTGRFAFSGGSRRAASVLGRRAAGRKVRGSIKGAVRTARMYGSRVSSVVGNQRLTKKGAIAAAIAAGSIGGGAYLASRDRGRQ